MLYVLYDTEAALVVLSPLPLGSQTAMQVVERFSLPSWTTNQEGLIVAGCGSEVLFPSTSVSTPPSLLTYTVVLRYFEGLSSTLSPSPSPSPSPNNSMCCHGGIVHKIPFASGSGPTVSSLIHCPDPALAQALLILADDNDGVPPFHFAWRYPMPPSYQCSNTVNIPIPMPSC